MSTKIEQKVAHDEKSKFFIFYTEIAYHTVRNVVVFFLKRFILIPENDEIPWGPCDQRKRRHFSVRCYIQINPYFSVRVAFNRIFVLRNFFNKCQRVIRAQIFTSVSKRKFRGSDGKLLKFCVVEIPDSVDFFRRQYLLPVKQPIARNIYI